MIKNKQILNYRQTDDQLLKSKQQQRQSANHSQTVRTITHSP